MTPEQKKELRWFAEEVAAEPCMPLLYRLCARIDPPPWWVLGGFLGVFLASRWNEIEEDPNPHRRAEEFVRVGRVNRLVCGFIMMSCLFVVISCGGVIGFSYYVRVGKNVDAAESDATILFCFAIVPAAALIGAIVCAVYLLKRRDWLRRSGRR